MQANSFDKGWTLFQFGFIVCIITSTHFAAEAYPSNPGPALVLVVGVKNIVSFGQFRIHFERSPTPHRYTDIRGDRSFFRNSSDGQHLGLPHRVHAGKYNHIH
jgi:hypothetical protein